MRGSRWASRKERRPLAATTCSVLVRVDSRTFLVYGNYEALLAYTAPTGTRSASASSPTGSGRG